MKTLLSSEPTLLGMVQWLGLFGYLYVLIGLTLLIWFGILIFRSQSLSNHCAYIASTLFPLVLGIAGAATGTRHLFTLIGLQGIPPGIDSDVVVESALYEILFQLYCGSILTCLFFPLGILALLIRKPK